MPYEGITQAPPPRAYGPYDLGIYPQLAELAQAIGQNFIARRRQQAADEEEARKNELARQREERLLREGLEERAAKEAAQFREVEKHRVEYGETLPPVVPETQPPPVPAMPVPPAIAEAPRSPLPAHAPRAPSYFAGGALAGAQRTGIPLGKALGLTPTLTAPVRVPGMREMERESLIADRLARQVAAKTSGERLEKFRQESLALHRKEIVARLESQGLDKARASSITKLYELEVYGDVFKDVDPATEVEQKGLTEMLYLGPEELRQELSSIKKPIVNKKLRRFAKAILGQYGVRP